MMDMGQAMQMLGGGQPQPQQDPRAGIIAQLMAMLQGGQQHPGVGAPPGTPHAPGMNAAGGGIPGVEGGGGAGGGGGGGALTSGYKGPPIAPSEGGAMLSGPNPLITPSFAHLFNQDQINAYALREPQQIVTADANGNIKTRSVDWWNPGAKAGPAKKVKDEKDKDKSGDGGFHWSDGGWGHGAR